MEFIKYEKDPVNGRWYAVKDKPMVIAQEIDYNEFMRAKHKKELFNFIGDGIATLLLFIFFYMLLIAF